MNSFLQLAAELARQGIQGFSMPRATEWSITGMGNTTATVDVADVGTLGATYVVPVNVNVGAGTLEAVLEHDPTHQRFVLEGTGGGAGAALGWSAAPVGGTYGGGEIPITGGGIELPSGGIGKLIAGPRAPSILAPMDLEGVVTLQTLEVNFAVNGLNAGVIVFADRPVTSIADFAFAKAVGLVAGIHLVGGSVSAGASAFTFRSRVRSSRGPVAGACLAP